MQRTPVRAGAAALLAACAVLTAGPADAKPKPTAEQLGRQAEILTEEYNRTRLELKQAQQALRSAQRQLRQTQADYERLRGEIGELAAASYMSPGSRAELALFAGDDPQAGLDKDAISRYLTAQQAGRLRELVLARMRYEQNAGRARDRAAEIKAKQAELAKKKAKIEKLISQIPKSAGGQGSPPNISVAGSGKASGAVRAALTRVGMPYVYGAAGPNSFDCSGLMLWAYKQVGISLPHYTGRSTTWAPECRVTSYVRETSCSSTRTSATTACTSATAAWSTLRAAGRTSRSSTWPGTGGGFTRAPSASHRAPTPRYLLCSIAEGET